MEGKENILLEPPHAWVVSRAAPAAASETLAGYGLVLSVSVITLSCTMQERPLRVYTYHWPFMSAIETGSQQPVITVAKQIST